jgi:hypothetical protein
MKKILILLLITLSLTTYAQKNYSIERPLYLGTVTAGSAADSVLVRGADKIVKFVPRSAFGGGVVTLQSAFNAGRIITSDYSIGILQETGTNKLFMDHSSVSFYDDSRGSLFNKNSIGGYQTDGVGSRSNTIIFDRTNFGAANYYFPEKDSGNYTLATLDDISIPTVQELLNTNYTVSDTRIIFNNDSRSTRLNGFGLLVSDPFVNSIGVYTNYSTGFIATSTYDDNSSLAVSFVRTTPGFANFKFPELTSGNYTLATTEEIKLKEYTVATLPSGTKGDVAFVNDAASPAFLATVVGGGSSVVRVFFNGSNWIVQ